MEKSEMIIRIFMDEGGMFAFLEDIKKLCERYELDYKKTKVLLLNKGFIKPIFRGIFYIKDYNEEIYFLI